MHRKSQDAQDQLKDDNTSVSNQSEKEVDEEDGVDDEGESGDESDEDNTSPTPNTNKAEREPSRSLSVKAEEGDTEVASEEEGGEETDDNTSRKEKLGKRHKPNNDHCLHRPSSPRSNHYLSETQEEVQMRIRQEIQTQMEQHHAAVMQQLAASSRNDSEEYRNNSIACLRAKAQEHTAKIFSLSADALMLVNNNPAAAAAFFHRSSLGAGIPPHYDANANNLPNIHNYYPTSGHQAEITPNDIVTSTDSSPIF